MNGASTKVFNFIFVSKLNLVTPYWVISCCLGGPNKSIVNRVVSVAHSGSIIYMHDTNTRTLLALPEIIRKIKAKGLGFSTICVSKR